MEEEEGPVCEDKEKDKITTYTLKFKSVRNTERETLIVKVWVKFPLQRHSSCFATSEPVSTVNAGWPQAREQAERFPQAKEELDLLV